MVTRPELDLELGSAFDLQSLMFSAFADETSVSIPDTTVNDFDFMIDADGKGSTLAKVLTLPIRQAPWSIQRGKASAEVASFITDIFTAPANHGGMTVSMNTLIAQALNAIIHRKAYFEKVFTLREGKVVYDKIAWRPPNTCQVIRDKRHGGFQGFKQEPVRFENTVDDAEPITIPPQRAWVYIHGVNRNPLMGVSDMEVVFKVWQIKQKIKFLWYSFLEGQALPKTVIHGPDRTTATAAAKEFIKLRQGGVVGFEDGITAEAYESSGRGAAQFKEALQWLDTEASGSVLAAFTDLGPAATGGTGSFALSKDQTDFFLMSRQAVSRELADSINQFVIPDIVHWNFGPSADVPYFEFGPISQDDMNAAIGLLQATSQSPSSTIPQEFFDELIQRVAGFLELDILAVRKGIERARREAKAKAEAAGASPKVQEIAGVAGAVNRATGAVLGSRPPQPSGSPLNRPPRDRLRPPDNR